MKASGSIRYDRINHSENLHTRDVKEWGSIWSFNRGNHSCDKNLHYGCECIWLIYMFLRVVTKLITVMKFTHRGCESVRFNSKSHLWQISHMTRVMWMYLTCLQCLMHSVTELITAVEVFTHAVWKSQFQSHSCVRLHSMVKLYSC